METFRTTGSAFAPAIFLLASATLLAQPVITSQPANQPVVWGGNATFSVMATGVGPLTYQWQLNGTNLPNNIISTVAGSDLSDGLPATNVIFNSLASVAVDNTGNLFVADKNNNVIREIGTNGMANVVAGTGIGGFGGDNGPATNALLLQPAAVACDTNGNLFISDTGNNRVRKVDTNGVITTVAGNGSIFGRASSGIATNVSLNFPQGLATDKVGDLYIADSQNFCVRKVSPGGTLSTVAGQVGLPGYSGDGFQATSAELSSPNSVALDKAGNIYITDTGNNRIRKVTTSGTISTVAGTGTPGYSGDGSSATLAKVNTPTGISVDIYTNLIIADNGNQRIRKITNGIIATIAGNGAAGFSGDGGAAASASLCFPQAVASDKAGNLYIVDSSNRRIREVATNGIIMTVAGRDLNDGDWATNGVLNAPSSTAQDNAGNIYIADTGNHRIRKIDTNGVISTYAGNGIPGFSGDGGLATNASLDFPHGVILDSTGDLLIVDQGNRRIRMVGANGNISTIAGKGSSLFSGDGGAATNAGFYPNDFTVDASGNLFIVDALNNRIRRVDTNGIITTVVGNGTTSYPGDGGAATNAGIMSPNCVAVDSVGNLFISFYDRVAKVDTNGNIFTVAGNGTFGYSGDGGPATNATFSEPYGIAVDPVGNVFVSDEGDACIRKVGTNGIITTIVGTGVHSAPTDNVPAMGTGLDFPQAIRFDNASNLLIADLAVNRIRKLAYLEYADQPSFTVTNVTSGTTSNNYSVIVTSASGSVTSSVVNLIVELPPLAPVFTGVNHTINFTWDAVSNLNYQLQYTTNLLAPLWKNLGDVVTATNGTASASDVSGADSQRFYRVLWVP